jgi:hypothetical protein
VRVPDPRYLPTIEEALALDRAVKHEIALRGLRRDRAGVRGEGRREEGRSRKRGVEYLVERLHRDGYL